VRDPETIGVIPDGNRRYARKLGISLREGYLRGVQAAERLFRYVSENTKTRNIYFYTLSMENVLKRSKQELSFLFKIFEKEAEKILTENEFNARIRFIGRRSVLPDRIQRLMQRVEGKTEENEGIQIILAVGYTGMAEVVDMVKNIAKKVQEGIISVEDIDENVVYQNLYAPDVPPPDFILRTSGEMRTSGFLPIQGVYAELIFYPKLWPEITEKDFEIIYDEYKQRERRFGR
jgi:tritrans,polycis-undecaprenyl-diphosphate synthase [geranylgeranyl-diphosphate specific]